MRTNKRLLNRVLAFLLVVLLLISTAVSVFADSFGGGTSGGLGGAAGGISGDYPRAYGGGWRISIARRLDLEDADNGTISSNSGTVLGSMLNYSVTISGKTNNIVTPFGVKYGRNPVVGDIGQLFPGLDTTGFRPNPVWRDNSKWHSDFCDEFWQTRFKPYIEVLDTSNPDKEQSPLAIFLSASGIWQELPEDEKTKLFEEYISGEIVFTVEPVALWQYGKIVFSMSFRDYIDKETHDAWMSIGQNVRFLNAAEIAGQGNSGSPSQYSKYILGTFRSNYENKDGIHIEVSDVSPDRGFQLFYMAGGTTPNVNKAETNIVVAYDGVPGTSDGTLRVNQSHNFVTSENAPSIKAYTTDSEITTINEESYKLILSSYGSTFMNPFNTSKSDSLEGLVDRLSDSAVSFFDDYVVSYGGSYKVNTAKADNVSITSNLINPLNDYINRLSSESVSWQNQPIEGGSFNIGSKKALSLGENKKPNDIASEIQQLSPFRDGTLKAVTASKIYSDILPDADPKPIVVNLALAALGGSRFGEFNTSTYTATEDNTYGLSIEFLTKKVPVTSYIAYATVDLTTGTAMLGRNESVTYDASGSGTFEIECDETAIFVAVPNTGSYSLEIEKTLSFFCNTEIVLIFA